MSIRDITKRMSSPPSAPQEVAWICADCTVGTYISVVAGPLNQCALCGKPRPVEIPAVVDLTTLHESMLNRQFSLIADRLAELATLRKGVVMLLDRVKVLEGLVEGLTLRSNILWDEPGRAFREKELERAREPMPGHWPEGGMIQDRKVDSDYPF